MTENSGKFRKQTERVRGETPLVGKKAGGMEVFDSATSVRGGHGIDEPSGRAGHVGGGGKEKFRTGGQEKKENSFGVLQVRREKRNDVQRKVVASAWKEKK